MIDLRFVYNWTEKADYGGEEYAATFADFEIYVGEECITQHVATDEEEKRVYDALRRPLYPIAEWLAGNWWNLFFESFTQGKTDGSDYAHRHNLRYGRDGFALPEVELRPEGDTVSVRWENTDLEYYRTKFIEEGHAHIQTESLRKAVAHEDAIDAPPGRAGRYSPVGSGLDGRFRLKKRRFVVRLLVCQRDEPAIPYTTPNIIWYGRRSTENGCSVAISRIGYENCF